MAMNPNKPTDPRSRGTANTGGRKEEWLLDPGDLRRQARILRERQRVGPLGKLVRYAAVVLLLVAAVAVYWNFDRLRGMTVDIPELTALLHSRAQDGGTARAGGEPGTAVVEAAGVAGVEAPTSLSEAPPAQAAAAPQPSATAAPAAAQTSPPPAAAPAQEPPALAAAPEPPPGPEKFSFGVERMEVSEGDASAAVLVLRGGDMRRASSVRWWTTDGTAKAGQDYVDLGRMVLKFAPNEQNRAIRVPIIGDKAVEGPENFYVNIAWGDDDGPTARIEVVIVDDD